MSRFRHKLAESLRNHINERPQEIPDLQRRYCNLLARMGLTRISTNIRAGIGIRSLPQLYNFSSRSRRDKGMLDRVRLHKSRNLQEIGAKQENQS